MDEFYAHDPFDGCHKKFSTAEAAEAEAHACIEYARDQDHWPEETDQIEWGRLVPLGHAQQMNRVEAADDDTGRCARDDLDYLCDYGLSTESDPIAEAIRERDEARAEVRRLTAALATARREGAEEMREQAKQRTDAAAVAAGEVDNTVTRRWLLDLAREIAALPLDAPGGGS